MGHYAGYILSSGNGANPEFVTTPAPFRPTASAQSLQLSDNTVLIAGGFPETAPDSPFALSATLQLNGDLTHLDEKNLATLARAEYSRHSNQSYRSYSLEADSRVTVLGNNVAKLHAFIDTYGGVLQIDAILLKGYDSQLTCGRELEIEPLQKGFRLHFTVKQPINMDRCTYCGSCGTICPEQCINEQLFLNFSRCSFCNQCLDACPHDAIDLHTIQRRELTTPALLLLNGTKTNLPEDCRSVYLESTLPHLFASIYASEVEEIIGWHSSYCQYSARLKTGCTACVDSCRHDALWQDTAGVQTDHSACVECGACISCCPTGALQYRRFEDMQFVEYFRTFPLPRGTTVVLGNEQSLHKQWWYRAGERLDNIFFMEHPQPAALHALHFLLLYAMGAERILIMGGKNSRESEQIQFSNTLLLQLFGLHGVIHLLVEEPPLSLAWTNNDRTARKDYYHDFSFSNRRQKLIDIIGFLRLQSDAQSGTIPPDTAGDFGEILCDTERCTHCLACVNECRIEALTADNAAYSLNHTPALCVQCGICMEICPENALSTRKGLLLQDAFFTEKIAAQAEPARCKGCGKIFGTQKSLEKVITILATKNIRSNTDDLLFYCDNCRIEKLYESDEK